MVGNLTRGNDMARLCSQNDDIWPSYNSFWKAGHVEIPFPLSLIAPHSKTTRICSLEVSILVRRKSSVPRPNLVGVRGQRSHCYCMQTMSTSCLQSLLSSSRCAGLIPAWCKPVRPLNESLKTENIDDVQYIFSAR